MLSLSEAEDAIVRRFHNAKRNLDLVAGVCFLISLIICPTLYFVFGNLFFILFLPVFLLVLIELIATCALMYLKKRALRRLENEQGAHNSAMDNSGYQTEPKMMPKKISGIVTIPQHERVLQQQLAQIHHVTYAPPQYETLPPPPYRVVILNNATPGVHQQDALRY